MPPNQGEGRSTRGSSNARTGAYIPKSPGRHGLTGRPCRLTPNMRDWEDPTTRAANVQKAVRNHEALHCRSGSGRGTDEDHAFIAPTLRVLCIDRGCIDRVSSPLENSPSNTLHWNLPSRSDEPREIMATRWRYEAEISFPVRSRGVRPKKKARRRGHLAAMIKQAGLNDNCISNGREDSEENDAPSCHTRGASKVTQNAL